MRQNILNIILAAVLFLLIGLTWGLTHDPGQPGYQFIPEMHYSVPYDAQSANPNFADGKTLRTPVEGTISQGNPPFHYLATEADAKRAGDELHNPYSKDSAAIAERGARLFRTYCQPCHGTTGAGDGIVTTYGFPPPPAFTSARVLPMKDGQLYHTITLGKGNMPSLASQISREDRWKIILQVRALQDMARQQAAATAVKK